MTITRIMRALTTATAMALCVPAQAQQTPAGADPAAGAGNSPEATNPAPQSLPAPERAKAETWQPFAAQGITLSLSYTGEAAANLTGGLRRDAAYTGQVYVGVDADMDRIAGIDGAAIHFAVTNRHGKNLSAIAIGNNTSVQEVFGTQNTHLAILTWEQKLWDDRLVVEAGRSQANVHFLNSPIYCYFQSNSACGNPTFVFKNSNFTYFPASSWMAHANLHLTPRLFVHTGVYEVNPDRKRANDSGFNLSTRNATGVIVPWEAGYATTADTDRLPRHYIIGGWFDRGDYNDPLLDDRGAIALVTGRSALTRHGRSGIYARFDQMLLRRDAVSDRGVTLFGVAMTNLSGRVEERHFLELGVLATGMLFGRDNDNIGFMINQQSFSDLAMARMRAARVSAGGSPDIRRNQYMMELTYGAQVSPAIRLTPNVQYILHPDQTGAPFRTRDIGNALVVGFKFTVDAMALNLLRPR